MGEEAPRPRVVMDDLPDDGGGLACGLFGSWGGDDLQLDDAFFESTTSFFGSFRENTKNADLLEGENIMFAEGAIFMDVKEDFVFHAEIGSGHFGRVFEITRRVDGKCFACKQLDKEKIRDPRSVHSEVKIMRRLEHPHILKILEVYETPEDAWIVTELCEGGDLLHHLMRRGGALSETAARTVMKQVLSGVAACHRSGVVHRDLKPENIMLVKSPKTDNDDDDVHLKIIDFGLSCIYDGEHELQRVVGSPHYMAPEVLCGGTESQGFACDPWSCGVIFYLLLCGRPPFASSDDGLFNSEVTGDLLTRKKRKRASVEELKQRISNGDFALDFGSWLRCSTEACELVCGLLRVDATLRLTAAEALKHTFIQIHEVARTDPEPLGAAALEALARFARTTFFHKRLYTTLAETLTTRELRILRTEFETLDADKDGFVSIQDLCDALKRRGNGDCIIEVESIFEACDLPADHLVSYDEFVLASVHRCRYLREDRVDALFREYLDGSKDKYMTAESLKKHGFDDDVISDIFESAQTKVDGQIDRHEFDSLLRLGRVNVRVKTQQQQNSNSTKKKQTNVTHPHHELSTTSIINSSTYSLYQNSSTHSLFHVNHLDVSDKSTFSATDQMKHRRDDVYLQEHKEENNNGYHYRRADIRERLHSLGVSDRDVKVLSPRVKFSPRVDGPFFSASERHLRDMEEVVDQAEEIDANSPEVLGKRAAQSLEDLRASEQDLDALLRHAQDEADKKAAEGKYLALAERATLDCKAAAIAYRKHDRLTEAIAAFRQVKNLTFILESRGVFLEDNIPKEETTTFAMPPPSDIEVQRRAERVIPRKRRSLAARFLPNPRRPIFSFARNKNTR